MSDPYYRWFPGDYIRDTGTLTLLEHGAYQMLLNYYYVMEGLPSNTSKIYHLLRSKKASERNAIESVLRTFFVEDGDRLVNKRADAEIAKRKEFLAKQSAKGKQSAEAKKANHGSTVVQPVFQPEVNLPSPSPLKKDQNPVAVKLYDFYAKHVSNVPAKRSDAIKSITKLLSKGHTETDLAGAVEEYANSNPGDKPYHANNFFGQKEYYRGFGKYRKESA